jgi:hypothetical protein
MSEAILLKLCRQYLNLLKNRKLLTYRRISTQGIRVGPDRFVKNEMIGMADMMVFLPGGRTLHIELKAEKGKLSSEQAAWRDEIGYLGHTYHVVRTLDELARILKEYGVKDGFREAPKQDPLPHLGQ